MPILNNLYFVRVLILLSQAAAVVLLFKFFSTNEASFVASLFFVVTGYRIMTMSFRLKEKISFGLSVIFLFGMAMPIGAMRYFIGGREEIQNAGWGDYLSVLHSISSPTYILLTLICVFEWIRFGKTKA